MATPSRGLLTWHAEGNNIPDSPYFSRVAHHPSQSSGVTIGRGYDMKERSRDEIVGHLTAAGVPLDEVAILADGARLRGAGAAGFIARREVREIVITEAAELALFEAIYPFYLREAERLCTKADVTEVYGECRWESFLPLLQEVIADLRFRGDYSPASRRLIQNAIVSGDLAAIRDAIDSIPGVPADRRRRRHEVMNQAIAIQERTRVPALQ